MSLTFHEKNSSVAILTLRNPKRKNALTVSMMEEMDRHVQTLARWLTRSGSGDDYDHDGNDGSSAQHHADDDEYLDDNAKGEGNNNARVVILTGSDGAFCAGLDLHDNERMDAGEEVEEGTISGSGSRSGSTRAAHSLGEGSHMIRHMTRVTNRLMSLPVLSVSAVDGHAVGGGAELTTATDLVVLTQTANI